MKNPIDEMKRFVQLGRRRNRGVNISLRAEKYSLTRILLGATKPRLCNEE
ncbi:hypothetical protein [Seinonella peptonophila]|nr:hypothetical protein [Seinonella peptonophila]